MSTDSNPKPNSTGTAYGVTRFPLPWPPASQLTIWTKRDKGYGVDLLALTDGSFIIETFADNQLRRRDAYQKVRFIGGSMGILSFVWAKDFTRLAINTTHLRALADAHDEVCEIKLSAPRPPRDAVHFEPIPNLKFTSREELFVETIKDIQSKLDQPSHYNLLRAAGMLRQLFLDENPLIHQINRDYRVSLKFEVIPFSDDLPEPPETYWCDISPDYGPPLQTIECSLDQFLKTRCLIHNRQNFTVYDVITCCSHVLGGVHAGVPKTEREKSLLSLQEEIRVGGHSMIDSTLKGIALVALWGCIPLLHAMFKGLRSAKS